jgi:hypothetical protein
MTIRSETPSMRAECVFGMQRLLPLLEAFSREIEGKNQHRISNISIECG